MFQDKFSTEELLGKTTDPRKLTLAELSKSNGEMADVATRPISTAVLLEEAKKQGSAEAVDRLGGFWTSTIERLYLAPFDLDRPGPMARDAEQVSAIRARNEALRDVEFTVINRGHRGQTLVMGGTLLSPAGYAANASSAGPFQMSPGFTGTPWFLPSTVTCEC